MLTRVAADATVGGSKVGGRTVGGSKVGGRARGRKAGKKNVRDCQWEQ